MRIRMVGSGWGRGVAVTRGPGRFWGAGHSHSDTTAVGLASLLSSTFTFYILFCSFAIVHNRNIVTY